MLSNDALTTFVTLETTLGNIVIELYPRDAPKTCDNFVRLATSAVAGVGYRGTHFHRVVDGELIQGGDTTGDGGASSFGHFFEDEISDRLRFSGAGVVAMAAAMPNVNGSQFFISLAPQPQLDGRYSIFGRVASGMDTVWRIAAQRVDPVTRRPLTDVTIRSCRCVHGVQRPPRPARTQRLIAPPPSAGSAATTDAAFDGRSRVHGKSVLAQLLEDE